MCYSWLGRLGLTSEPNTAWALIEIDSMTLSNETSSNFLLHLLHPLRLAITPLTLDLLVTYICLQVIRSTTCLIKWNWTYFFDIFLRAINFHFFFSNGCMLHAKNKNEDKKNARVYFYFQKKSVKWNHAVKKIDVRTSTGCRTSY